MRVSEYVTYHSKLDDRELMPGFDVPTLVEWVQTLSTEEQQEFAAARNRQNKHRQDVIDEGKMVMINYTYVWKDQASAEQNKITDPIWQYYFQKWCASQDMYIIRKKEPV